jgi:4,5-DOPA dioxygenase extradiol
MKNSASSILYICHGGGPMPLLAGDEAHEQMRVLLKQLSTRIKKPSAIIVLSAHWEAQQPTITSGANPELIYDYSGFPEESYHIHYPAAGEPALAKKIANLLQTQGIEAKMDAKRGLDHGVFIPLKIMYPAADIPCVQVSLLRNLDALKHIQIGEALAPLKNENVLILGSGFSFHNMQAFFGRTPAEVHEMNQAFENWLIETCSSTELSESERKQRLVNWTQAPHARYCHPREEHLLPLHVCYGVAQTACSETFELEVLGVKASCYLWQSLHE